MRQSSVGCVGRDLLGAEVADAATRAGAVLLFGGRQAGKSTLLRHLATRPSDPTYHVDTLSLHQAMVYVDLMTLPSDAKPTHCFDAMARAALSACAGSIAGFQSPPLKTESSAPLDTFVENITHIVQAAGNVDLRFTFLLDESKRVLGSRFPRSFQDNLFALLYGELEVSHRCAIVFAGGQELYSFCEDDTSPIGSRAAKLVLKPLAFEAVIEIVTRSGCPDANRERVAREVFGWTGGHAGLTMQLCHLVSRDWSASVDHAAQLIQAQHSELFAIWRERLSREARAVHDQLASTASLTRPGIAQVLARAGLDVLRSERAGDEIEFTGIGAVTSGHLSMTNQVYRLGVADVIEALADGNDDDAWVRIREAELAARTLVTERYSERWGSKAERRMEEALGTEQWAKIIGNRDQHSYRLTRRSPQGKPILDYAYLGQLGSLMLWGPAWDMFKGSFRDKRQLEDLLNAIKPVRNDLAHFRVVPAKELDRCRITADDLVAILEREAESRES